MQARNQNGFALLTTVIIVLVAGILLSSTVSTTRQIERTAGNAIQYSRAMAAAEGGIAMAERSLLEVNGDRAIADQSATEGIFSLSASTDNWRDEASFVGEHVLEPNVVLGVASQPRYVIKELGTYVSDGGTGVVNMDTGGGGNYGSMTTGGRELTLYKIESLGVGSDPEVTRVIESIVVVAQ